VLPLLVQLGSSLEPLSHQFDFRLRCRDAPLGLLLEKVKNVNAVRKPHGVYGPKRVTLMISDDLQNASAETL